MTTEVRTPFSTSAVELSDGGLWRKQILKFDTIDYLDAKTGERRKLTFDRKYGEDLIAAFKAGAYPQVPFQFADGQNRHNNDPRNTGGEVVAVALSRDGSGVDGFLRTWGDGTRVVEQNPKLGVSARILEDLTTTDGRSFPRAVQHVLATVDPQMRDMRPWERVESVDLAFGTVAEALDLSNETYEGSARMPEKQTEGTTTLELSTAKAERLRTLLEEDEALEALAAELGDEFFEALDNSGEDEDDEADDSSDEEDEEEDVNLSGGSRAQVIELTNAHTALEAQVLELSTKLANAQINADVAEFGRQGLAPAVLEAARPLLGVAPGVVELSNGVPGESVDPGAVLREVLSTVIDLANSGHLLVDPDEEAGSLHGDTTAKSQREAMLADWNNYG